MQSIHVLYWALSVLCCLSLLFAILLWCRSWRREEREETGRRIQRLSDEMGRIAAAVDALENTAASLEMADGKLAGHLGDLGKALGRLESLRETAGTGRSPAPGQAPEGGAEVEGDRYAAARDLLRQGKSPVEVSRRLDMGTAEVRMIARTIDQEAQREEARGEAE
jgi:hypothetical protein